MTIGNCPLCNNPAKINEQGPLGDYINYNCDICGNYSLTGSATATIQNPEYRRSLYLLSGYIRSENEKRNNPQITTVEIERLVKGYFDFPKTALDKVHRLMFYLEKHARYLGEPSKLNSAKMYPIVFAKRDKEFDYIIAMACQMSYIKYYVGEGHRLTIEGYIKIDQLKEINIASKNCFVASSFCNEYDEVVKNAISPALAETGFNLVYLKTKEHNELIDDEIISGIKSSKFIIAEFSSGNQGVYFEAGFAMGLKIPVIRVCKKGAESNLHFDVEHYQTIFYENIEELKNKLIKRIQATIL